MDTPRWFSCSSLPTLVLAVWIAVGFHSSADGATPPPPPASSPVGQGSPVDFFRQLLALTPAERTSALARKAPAQREILLAKVDEYSRMPPQEREVRFRLLEVRVYTLRLLQAAQERRPALLEETPAPLRDRIRTRLSEWDTLSPVQQQQILQDELSLHVFLYRGFGGAPLNGETLQRLIPPSRRQEVESSMTPWRSLSEQDRQDLARRVANLLKLQPQDQMAVLKNVPAKDRVPLEMTLRRYARLTPEQRERCLEGFGKLAALSVEERRLFLMQARLWQEISPQQRELFRALAQSTSPERALPPFPPSP